MNLLEKMQGGYGGGYLQAVSAGSSSDVHDAIMHCLGNDPRWCKLLDERAKYYGDVIILSQMSLDKVKEALQSSGSTAPDLLYSVLLYLVDKQYKNSSAILIQYLEDYIDLYPKRDWDVSILGDGFERLPEDSHEEFGFHVMLQFDNSEELAQTLDILYLSQYYPWNLWAKKFLLLRGALTYKRNLVQQREESIEAESKVNGNKLNEILSLYENIDRLNAKALDMVEGEFLSKISMADEEQLLMWLDTDNMAVFKLATKGLKAINSPRLLGKLIFFIDFADKEKIKIDKMNYCIKALGWCADRIETAKIKEWFISDSPPARIGGQHLILNCNRFEEIDVLNIELANALKASDTMRITAILEIIANLDQLFVNKINHQLLEQTYNQLPYTYGRKFVLKAMDNVISNFDQSDIIFESLWDCQSECRELACQYVSLTREEAVTRLQQIVNDDYEDENVRQAAGDRC